MKHKIALLCALLGFSTLFLNAQSASITEGCVPLEVSFSPPAGATGFFWDFQNGATSTLSNPDNTFASPGVYEVAFSEGPGEPVIGQVTITVYAKPEPGVTFDPAGGCTPLEVSFNDDSTVPDGVTITSYNWTFGDGESANGVTDPTHTYTIAGDFDVSLSLQSNLENCTVTEIFPDAISTSSPANVAFSTNPNPPFACEPPLTVIIGNQTTGGGPNLVYNWDFGNGQTFTGPNPPAQTFNEIGSFDITLTVTDDNDCEATFTRTVRIGPPRARPVIPDTVCVGDSIMVENLSDPGAYTWNFGPDASPSTSDEFEPTVRFLQEGTYEVTLTVNNVAGCQGDTVITVFADQAEADFEADPTYSCTEPVTFSYTALSDEATGFLWLFSDGSTSTESNPTRVYENTDTTTYGMNGLILDPVFLEVTNPSGCKDTLVLQDSIFVPNARFAPDLVDGCAPLTVTFSDSSNTREPITQWELDLGDGNIHTQNDTTPYSYTYTEPGEYDVVLNIENAAGCIDTSYAITIRVGEPLTIDLLANETDICQGDTVTFTGVGDTTLIEAWHIETEDGRAFHCYQDAAPSWPVDGIVGPTDVTLTVEYNGCLSTITKEDFINVRGPLALIDYEIDCEAPFDVTFRDSTVDATILTWDLGDTIITNPPGAFVHTYGETGDYQVTLTAEDPGSGCPASVDSALVCIRDIQASFEIDSLLCAGQTYQLDASSSIDVDNDCWKGFDWFFEISNRPITTQDSIIDFTFSNPGEETITLVTEDINGCTDTFSRDARIFTLQPEFTVDDDFICYPAPLSFTDLSTADTTITSWEWSFGSTEQNPVTTIEDGPGDTLEVTLTIIDALGCPATVTRFLEVYEPVSTVITDPTPANLCVGDSLAVFATDYTAAGSNLVFSWDFGNGQTADTQAAGAVYPESGEYALVLDFEEVGTGCGGEVIRFVSVQDFPVADFTSSVDNDPVICYPEQIVFSEASTASVPLSYVWDFGNGQGGLGPSPSGSFDKGTFEVQMIATTPFGCADTVSRSFTLVGPEGDFSVSEEAFCVGDTITFTLLDTEDVSSFTWNFGDGEEVDNVSPVDHLYITAPPSGQTVATLVLRGANDECEIAVEQPLIIRDVTADFLRLQGQGNELCSGQPFRFDNTSTGADTFEWDFGNGDTSTSDESPVFSVYPEGGVYTVRLTASDSQLGCTNTVQKDVIINDGPTIVFNEVDPICRGDSIDLETLISEPTNIQTTWFITETTDTLTEAFQFPEDDQSYTVFILDEFGCEADSFTVVDVVPCVVFGMPNAFTPNGDNNNDFFNVATNGEFERGDYQVLTFKVYNRWGNLVYDNDTPGMGWDGTFNGEPSPSDVYLYLIEVEYETEEEEMAREVFQGEVVLLR